jgi:hypothetical protein
VITCPIQVITSLIRVITMADPGDHDGPFFVITTRRFLVITMVRNVHVCRQEADL